jgi:hypothetical protein
VPSFSFGPSWEVLLSVWSAVDVRHNHDVQILGNDVRSMDNFTLSLLSSPEIIAVNQDSNCVQGSIAHAIGSTEVWIKPLSSLRTFSFLRIFELVTAKQFAVVLFNHGPTEAEVTLFISPKNNNLGDFYPAAFMSAQIRDIYAQQDLGLHVDIFKRIVGPHDAQIFLVTPVL